MLTESRCFNTDERICTLNPIDAALHLLNFAAPALLMGLTCAFGAKLLWRQRLRSVAGWSLACRAAVAALVAEVVGLVWSGHDAKMVGYAAMTLACAAVLWWPMRRG